MPRLLVLALLTVLAAGLAACGGGSGSGGGGSSSGAGGGGSSASNRGAMAQPGPGGGGGGRSTGGCASVAQPGAKNVARQSPPRAPLKRGLRYELTFQTSCGPFSIVLDLGAAPHATASMVELAKNGFFDGTFFHRIVPGFVIQGGDPTGTGSGGPGYSTRDKPARGSRYTKGVVAMAKTGSEPAGTAGSQFFVVTGDNVGLPPDYAIVGRVVKGLDVVERIGRLGDSATQQPTQPVVIRHVVVKVS